LERRLDIPTDPSIDRVGTTYAYKALTLAVALGWCSERLAIVLGGWGGT